MSSSEPRSALGWQNTPAELDLPGNYSRRQVMKGIGAAAAVSIPTISGCSGNDDPEGNPGNSTETDKNQTTSANQPTQLSELNFENLELLPVITPQNRENSSVVQTQIQDQDGLKTVDLYLEGEKQDQPVQIHHDEPGGDKNYEMRTKFLQQAIAPGENRFRLEVTDSKGKTEEFTSQPFQTEKTGYRLQPQQFGNYETRREWDSTEFQQERINQQRQQWQKAARYEPQNYDRFIDKLKNEGDLRTLDYPSSYPGDAGNFDLQKFKNANSFREILDWIDTAVKIENTLQHQGPPSGHANEMAASAEHAIDELHPNADTRAWGVYNPGHGSMMFYNEDSNADQRWFHVDTTADIIQQPENALSHRNDVWSPFRSPDAEIPGFHEGITIEEVGGGGTYRDLTTVARNSLLSMVTNAANSDKFKYGKTFMTDEWMDDAYQHIRDGGKIDPILEPVEELVDHQMQTGEFVGIYGSGLDDIRLVAGDDLKDMYDEVMTNPDSNVTADQIESMLERQAAA